MKYIKKEKEPIEFSQWKAQDKMYQHAQPNWNRLKSSLREIIKDSLISEQGGICCYCERELLEDDFHPEHIKPQSKFPELQLEYTNLLCSCQLEVKKTEQNHCAMNKKDWFDEELFVSPLNPDCQNKFEYTFDGYIQARQADDLAAKTTIEKLNLNVPKLVAMRRNAIGVFLDGDLSLEEVNTFAKGYLKSKENKFNPFYTSIENLFVSKKKCL